MSKELLNAVKLRELDKITEIINNNSAIDINIKDENGYTPLFYACIYGDYNIGKILIEKGADVNEPDNNGVTALMIAVTNYDLPTIAMLIDAGVNIEHKDEDGNTAIDIAKYASFSELAYMLEEARSEQKHAPKDKVKQNFCKQTQKHTALRRYIRSNLKR